MSPSKIKEKVVMERLNWIQNMIDSIRSLPINEYESFVSDNRNIASAESYLRRCFEALFDMGRNILAKAFNHAASEYKEISDLLYEQKIISKENHSLFKQIAGYRNRMAHYYNEISDKELFDICSNELQDIEKIVQEIKSWIRENPDLIEKSI